ncbi:sugar phosphate isomerase/epimerase family protein [Ferrovibrio sp.]|uniref:sugar phosphate isomerase/epimerase family protein n=1 Tax=Ferrovibrio sp. TaxID=1917215 RepID=UPI00391D18DC
MQGRLLPPYDGRFQAFPARAWREEFPLAAEAGLSCIEWIYEKPHEQDNPLRTDIGLAELRALSASSGVRVRSICADYYMTERLVDEGAVVQAANIEHLKWLIGRASLLEITYIVLPFVDASSLRSEAALAAVIAVLRDLAPHTASYGVELHLETDLPPATFRELLAAIGHEKVKANFDIGNSASLGYDPVEELTALAPYLGSVHVKDRKLGGSTQPLGTGNADLPAAFRMIRKTGFERWLILQAARGEDGGEVELARHNRDLTEKLWEAAA